jgi:hypothetical protein
VRAEDEQERLIALRAGGNVDHELARQGLGGRDNAPSASPLEADGSLGRVVSLKLGDRCSG